MKDLEKIETRQLTMGTRNQPRRISRRSFLSNLALLPLPFIAMSVAATWLISQKLSRDDIDDQLGFKEHAVVHNFTHFLFRYIFKEYIS